jgi:GDPmannose 4,6-dehydratase
VRRSSELLRPTDIAFSAGNPEKARRSLGWSTQLDMPRVVERMIQHCLA